MLKIMQNKSLGSKCLILPIAIFLIFISIAASAPLVNTQTHYLSSIFQGLFNTPNLLYQQPLLPYTNYPLNPSGSSLSNSFNPIRYPVSFSQSNSTNYFFQTQQNRSSLFVDYHFLSQNIFSTYQSSTNLPYNQTSFIKDWSSPSYNISFNSGYISSAGYISSILPINIYAYTNYPSYSYDLRSYTSVTTNHQQQHDVIIGSIGIITDIHYTDEESTDRRTHHSLSGPRFYSEAGDDLADFVSRMNFMGVDAAIELGDFIDVHSGNSPNEGNSNIHNDGAHGEAILFEAESIYSKLTMPYYHVIGNWDMYDRDFATADDWFKYIINGTPETIDTLGGTVYTDAIGNPASRYYSFKFGSVLGIALDSSGRTLSGDEYLMNTTGIGGTGYVPKDQLIWLKTVLAENTNDENLPVIIFIHQFLYPVITGYYMCKNHSDVRSILEADKNVIAVINGHHHPGAHGWWEDILNDPYSNDYNTATGVFGKENNGIKYYNLRGSIIGWGSDSEAINEEPSNAYYILRVKKGASLSVAVETFRTN